MRNFRKIRPAVRPGQSAAAGRWDKDDGEHTWPVLDRVEILAATEDDRAAAYSVLEELRGPILGVAL